MVNFYIFLKDYSGAAKGDGDYHDKHSREVVRRFKSDMKKIKEEELISEDTESEIIYIVWGTYCYQVKEEEIYTRNAGWSLRNEGGYPEDAINFMYNIFRNTPGKNTIKLLYLMTKNKISSTSIATSFAMNEGANYENFVFHAFHHDDSKIDLSLASSFLKKRCAVYKNFELIDDVDISREFNYDKININNFATEKNLLKSYIKLKFINKFKHYAIVLKELNKLKKLRWRLFKESQHKISLKIEIVKFVTALIKYVASDKNDYSFDALKIEMEFKDSIEEEIEEEMEFDPVLEEDSEKLQMSQNKFKLLENIVFQRAKILHG